MFEGCLFVRNRRATLPLWSTGSQNVINETCHLQTFLCVNNPETHWPVISPVGRTDFTLWVRNYLLYHMFHKGASYNIRWYEWKWRKCSQNSATIRFNNNPQQHISVRLSPGTPRGRPAGGPSVASAIRVVSWPCHLVKKREREKLLPLIENSVLVFFLLVFHWSEGSEAGSVLNHPPVLGEDSPENDSPSFCSTAHLR